MTDEARARPLVEAAARAATDLGESGKELAEVARAWLGTGGGSRAARTGATQWATVCVTSPPAGGLALAPLAHGPRRA